MAKLTPAQKQKAKGIKSARVTEMRAAQGKANAPKPAAKAPMKEPVRTKGITNIIKKRANAGNVAFQKASRGK